MVGLDGGLPTPFRCTAVCIGATIVLPIASWERRFILERRFIDTAEGDDSSQAKGDDSGQAKGHDSGQVEGDGGGEDGGGGSADGFYGMMLMSSTHHRFAGLFTIRRPGAPPVTQLLVRGSPVYSQKSR